MTTVFAQATLAWLLTYLVHSTVLLGAALLLVRLRRATPAAADVTWKAALLGGVLTASLQGALQLRPAGTFFLGAVPASTLAPQALGDAGSPAVKPDASQGATDAAKNSEVARESATLTDDPSLTGGSTTASTATSLPSPAALLAIIWAVIAVALVAWYAGRRLILVGRLGDRRPVVDGATLAMLEELRRDTRAKTRVLLTASATISSPVALGGGEVCLPAAALTDLDGAQRRAMLAHELAHLERRDPQWLSLACLIERAFFFQPLNRIARRRLQENAEYLADEWAARHSGGVSLAKALVKVAEWIQASPLSVPVAGFAEERSQLTTRVTRLLDGAMGAPRTGWGVVAMAGGVLLLTAGFAPGVSSAAPATDPNDLYTLDAQTRAPAATESKAPLPSDEPVIGAVAPRGRGPGASPSPSASRIGVPGAGPWDGTLPKDVVETDTAIVRAVMARLRDENADVRRAAADALGRMKHPMAIDALVITLDDLELEVRKAALNALGNFEHSRVPAPPIRRMLEAEDTEIRSQSVRMLAEMRDRASIPAITRLLQDADDEVRHSALHALEELQAPIADEVIVRALADRSDDVREAAVNLAGERQLVTVVPQLTAMLEDRSGSVREQAAQALTEMRTPQSDAALRKALTHRDPNVRRVAVEYFGERGDP